MSLHKEISFETETKGAPDSSPGYAGKLRCSALVENCYMNPPATPHPITPCQSGKLRAPRPP